MVLKRRLSATVDADVLEAAERAAASGAAVNVSAWVNDAMRAKLEHDRQLAALAALVTEYEAVEGAISDDELVLAARAAKRKSMPVRGTRAGERRSKFGR
ncbi:MAG: hypothetical protein KBG28_03610 [Kofleriaceae bacterium]|jgi:hypothetical protein|nr:hypothetical protein [Kofleriaceae bacterium]MBP6838584.1 hypothetical protein [Kofleriaceae bacterium]MBP9203048.1 hypothetical protein [Kofleriaceae bacterium]